MMKLHKNDTIIHENNATSRRKSKIEKKGTPKMCVNHTHMFIDCDVHVKQSSCTHDCAQF